MIIKINQDKLNTGDYWYDQLNEATIEVKNNKLFIIFYNKDNDFLYINLNESLEIEIENIQKLKINGKTYECKADVVYKKIIDLLYNQNDIKRTI